MNKKIGNLMNEIRQILPNATIGEDNDGQIVIYTDVMVDSNNNLIPLQENTDAG